MLSSDTGTFGNDNALYGRSPFRELQLRVNKQLAGVAWPFPAIFTGGVIPGFWRPVVGIDALDLLEDEIDITPFLPKLVDDREHTFEIRVVGIEDDGTGHGKLTNSIEWNWVVEGKVFLWLETDMSIAVGSRPSIHAPEPSIILFSSAIIGSDGTVESLELSIHVARSIHI